MTFPPLVCSRMPGPPNRLITSPRTIELPPVMVRPGAGQAVAVQLDERRACGPGCVSRR